MTARAHRTVFGVTLTGLCLAAASCGGVEAKSEDSGETGEEIEDLGYDHQPQTVSYFFGNNTLAPYQEELPCASWTVNNEEPLYVARSSLANNGMYHHSTWMVVPEYMYEGPDGFWDCDSRNWDEVIAATSGSVLIAQSTQSLFEQQQYGPDGSGTVVKIPKNSKIVAVNHMLNVADREVTTGMTMTLDLIHPSEVQRILKPFRYAYWDLQIPAGAEDAPAEADFVNDCALDEIYEDTAGKPLDMKLHFVLPHTHDLGSRFYVDVVGGPRDGERIVDHEGFNAQGNGITFEQPIDMTGATGLRLTCGYTNPRTEPVGYGIGDQEMCEMLGMAETDLLIDHGIHEGTQLVETLEDGTQVFKGECESIAFPASSKQSMPDAYELDFEEIYVPQIPPGHEAPPAPECVEFVPGSVPAEQPATLSSIKDTVFAGCTWSSCHSATGEAGAAGLNLDAPDLHAELLAHQPQNVAIPLVDPGNPEGSWLYQRIAQCAPQTDAGVVLEPMPAGTPALMDHELIAKVYDWIAAGAPNN